MAGILGRSPRKNELHGLKKRYQFFFRFIREKFYHSIQREVIDSQ